MRKPVEVWPLASFLCDEMEARGWQTQDVAVRMGGKTSDDMAHDLLELDLIMCVQDDKLTIGDETFLKLSQAFGVSAECFKNLDAKWREWPDRREPFEPPDSIFGEISQYSIPKDTTDE